jgi:hypothetical protein
MPRTSPSALVQLFRYEELDDGSPTLTSIAHPVLPGAVPAVGGSSTAPATTQQRLLQPAGSKAVRLGLGVAIAAVMAGDVYAVLRSPVSEGRGVGSPAASAAGLENGDGSAAGRFASAAGHVATNPFSEAAYGAALGRGFGSGGAVAARAAMPAGPAGPAATTALPTAPAAAPAGTIVLPTLPAGPSFGTPSQTQETSGPGGGGGGGGGGEQTAPTPAGPLAQVAEVVADVSVVGTTLAPVITDIDSQLPPAPEPVAETVETVVAPVTASLPKL